MKRKFQKTTILLSLLISFVAIIVMAVLYFEVKKDTDTFFTQVLMNISNNVSEDIILIDTILDGVIQSKEISYHEESSLVMLYTTIGNEFNHLKTANIYLRSISNSPDHIINYTAMLTNFFAQSLSKFDNKNSNRHLNDEEIQKLDWIRQNNDFLYLEKIGVITRSYYRA
ncbi:hypothetical protein [Bacillus litorisediminis]|uniref:hypothetical protein n=1 Tax=Bacillus litorisediminis TaxID=2922713 RepID=UPI001FABDA6F|nr:hypothetical protein [Bacillus litorisediminis]